MSLRYSYKVELERYEYKLMSLRLALKKNPKNVKLKEKMAETEEGLAWYKERIQNGKDPGVHIV